jgi:Holliday junction resolvase RusA-like endonuclease
MSNEIVKATSVEVSGGGRSPLAGYPMTGALYVCTVFHFVRPGSGVSAKDGWPTNRNLWGDGDTLTRCVWDALTHAKAITDDSMIVSWRGCKIFDEREGVEIVVKPA